MDAELGKELRLGNIVHHNPSIWSYRNDDGVISNYGKLLEDCFKWEIGDWFAICECTLSWDAIEPVKLTEELLLKCGFEKVKNKINIFVNGRLKYWIGNNGGLAYLKNEDSDESYFIPNHDIKYLHQLQNLYFVLTGQELDVSQIIDQQ